MNLLFIQSQYPSPPACSDNRGCILQYHAHMQNLLRNFTVAFIKMPSALLVKRHP